MSIIFKEFAASNSKFVRGINPTVGARACEIAMQYFNGEKIAARVNMPLDIVAKGNAEAFKASVY